MSKTDSHVTRARIEVGGDATELDAIACRALEDTTNGEPQPTLEKPGCLTLPLSGAAFAEILHLSSLIVKRAWEYGYVVAHIETADASPQIKVSAHCSTVLRLFIIPVGEEFEDWLASDDDKSTDTLEA